MFRDYWEIIKIGFKKRFAITCVVVLSITIAQASFIPTIIHNLSLITFVLALFPFSIFCLPSYLTKIQFGIEMLLKPKKNVPVPDEFLSLANQFGVKIQSLKIINNIFNAGATPRGKIILGTTLLRNLNLDQQKGVIAHELAHIKRRHHMKLGLYLVVVLVVVLPYTLIISSPLPQMISCLAVLAMMMYFLMPVQWFTEFDADKYAAKIIGKDNMIAALEAIPGDPHEGSEDHPPIAIRIKRLKALSS